MKKMKLWEGQIPETDIKEVAIKIDGIQAMLNDEGQVVSRSNKPLYNIDPQLLEPGKKYEVFLGSFKLTDSVLSTHNHVTKVNKNDVYEIWPGTDPRLVVPFDSTVEEIFNFIVSLGHEGLILDKKYKVKTEETYDVPITGVIPGKKKYTGMMGALMTPMGKVGTGFTDAERKEDWHARIGEMIEVSCMQLTPDGKFRHPRYQRRRWDKS